MSRGWKAELLLRDGLTVDVRTAFRVFLLSVERNKMLGLKPVEIEKELLKGSSTHQGRSR